MAAILGWDWAYSMASASPRYTTVNTNMNRQSVPAISSERGAYLEAGWSKWKAKGKASEKGGGRPRTSKRKKAVQGQGKASEKGSGRNGRGVLHCAAAADVFGDQGGGGQRPQPVPEAEARG